MGRSRTRNAGSRSSADIVATQLLRSLTRKSPAALAVNDVIRRLREQNPDDNRSDQELESLIANMAIAQGLPIELDGSDDAKEEQSQRHDTAPGESDHPNPDPEEVGLFPATSWRTP